MAYFNNWSYALYTIFNKTKKWQIWKNKFSLLAEAKSDNFSFIGVAFLFCPLGSTRGHLTLNTF